jgi:demethylmenaquinone methyltransferase/2-methoxy-6-polyprenyl-1,4-benzoquinol methylase
MNAPLQQQDPRFVKSTFSAIASRYDLANHLLSGGLDFLWRFRVARLGARHGPKRILDLATGSGDLAIALKKACPDASVTAADFCLPMLAQARRKGVPALVQADALALPFADASFDLVTVAFGLRNMADWQAAVLEMRRVLADGGRLIVLDFSLPENPVFLPIYRYYLHHVLPGIAGALTQSREAYRYLGESIESFPSGLNMNALIRSCGFQCEPPRAMTFGIVSVYCGMATGGGSIPKADPDGAGRQNEVR